MAQDVRPAGLRRRVEPPLRREADEISGLAVGQPTRARALFDVDYHFEGRVGQDYVFPLMPDSDIVIPFVTIRRRNDGSVMVTAPAFTGGSGPFGARAKMMGLPDKGDGPHRAPKAGSPSRPTARS